MSLPKVAYFTMEIALDQSLHTYSGGLGFLSGSHMLSAGYLKLPMIGVSMLWAHGYGEQSINADNRVEINYQKREYDFLTDTGIIVDVRIFGENVKVKAMRLEPETFGSVPVYFLTTDIPENTQEQRDMTNVLYAGDQRTRIAQEIILGIGGYRVLEAAGENPDLIHINEGHALPVFFEMLDRHHQNLDEVRKRAVFTTHTPVAAGNESHPAHLLAEAGFFANTDVNYAMSLGGEDFSLTVAALRMSHLSNGVSQLHGHVANSMWEWVSNRSPIKAITNAVYRNYWQEDRIRDMKNPSDILTVKKEMKHDLFAYVKEHTGKVLDPDVLTLVWARRFTQYKRPGLIFHDPERLTKLLEAGKLQLIFAGKFHPSDTGGQEIFNNIIDYSLSIDQLAILPNYELELSRLLKRGADVWLNTPLRPLEASGTSGMSANLNAAIHVSTFDGWAVEGTFHDVNGYIINEHGHFHNVSIEDRNKEDYESMMDILENKVIPMYYDRPEDWTQLVWNAIHTAEGYFDSQRMAVEYYNTLYRPVYL